jgi:diaminohydroxyphosphoribosylaminopyrimidine deaminase / 5-amino-6-(5-phosphoribosylamino)uracil reductase
MISDEEAMDAALALARSMLGKTTPNPSVGCVIVQDGRIVGRGATQAGGRPHAEAMALAEAGAQARGATAYVTLEPCAHRSPRGPACADTLIAAGVARVVGALVDPDPRTAGAGFARLSEAGIRVEVGQGAEGSRRVLAGFIHRLAAGRPLVWADAEPEGYDGPFDLGFRETFEQALDRMGRAGFMRVRVEPGSPIALALAARGLLADPWR